MKKFISMLLLAIISFTAAAQETVTISPTWKQSFHWANNGGWIILGIALIAAAAFLLFKFKDDGKLGIMLIAFVLIAGGLTSILSKPCAVKWNNDKKVDKVYLDKVGEKHVWDSLEVNCLIVDGPHDCYSKPQSSIIKIQGAGGNEISVEQSNGSSSVVINGKKVQ